METKYRNLNNGSVNLLEYSTVMELDSMSHLITYRLFTVFTGVVGRMSVLEINQYPYTLSTVTFVLCSYVSFNSLVSIFGIVSINLCVTEHKAIRFCFVLFCFQFLSQLVVFFCAQTSVFTLQSVRFSHPIDLVLKKLW